MAYLPDEQQRQFRMWGQAPPPNNWGHSPSPNNLGQSPPPNNWGQVPPPNNWGQVPPPNNWGQAPPRNNPLPLPQQGQWITPQQSQMMHPQKSQGIQSNEPWRTVPPAPEQIFSPLQMQFQGHEAARTSTVLIILCKLIVLVVGIAAAIFGILALADVPYHPNYSNTPSPGVIHFWSDYSEWPIVWLATLICQSSFVCADILFAVTLLILSFAKPKFKLGTATNILLVIFNITIGLVGIWLMVALLVEDGEGNMNICPEGSYGRCGRVKMMICATVFTLLLSLLFIPTYLRLCCSLTVVIK